VIADRGERAEEADLGIRDAAVLAEGATRAGIARIVNDLAQALVAGVTTATSALAFLGAFDCVDGPQSQRAWELRRRLFFGDSRRIALANAFADFLSSFGTQVLAIRSGCAFWTDKATFLPGSFAGAAHGRAPATWPDGRRRGPVQPLLRYRSGVRLLCLLPLGLFGDDRSSLVFGFTHGSFR